MSVPTAPRTAASRAPIVPPRPRTARCVVLAAALLGACTPTFDRVAPGSSGEGALRAWTDGRLVVLSPYDADATALWGRALAEELRLVQGLLAARLPPSLTVRLAPVPVTESRGGAFLDTLGAARAGRDWVGGYVLADGTAVVHVPERDDAPYFTLQMLRPTLRHELVHVVVRHGDLPRTRWLDEGLASLVEDLPVDARGQAVWDGVVSARTLSARALDPALGWRELAEWPYLDAHAPRDREALLVEARRYALATSLVEYGLRSGDGPFAERLARFLTLEPAWLETSWREWLAQLDVVADVEHALDAADPVLRRDAAYRLAQLAGDARFPELHGERADRVALRALADPVTTASAQRFLLFGRSSAVAQDVVRAMERSRDPLTALTAQALRARRGEPVDQLRVETTWAQLDARTRTDGLAVAHALGLPR